MVRDDMPLTVWLATGERREYTDDDDYAVGVSFGTGIRDGWLHVLRHDLKKDLWENWAYFPPGGWLGVEGARDSGVQEVPNGIGFRGPAHNLEDRATQGPGPSAPS
jgi:hypothetical protein